LDRTIATVQRVFLRAGPIAIGPSPGNFARYGKAALRSNYNGGWLPF
jgi:hypothetical protein